MDTDTELVELFYKHCPSAKGSEDVVKDIIKTVGCHTLTVCLSASSLTASGMEPEELEGEARKTSGGMEFGRMKDKSRQGRSVLLRVPL